MSACTFFGHRDCPDKIYHSLCEAVEKMIVSNKVRTFYVGTQGNFDALAYKALREISVLYPEIKIFRVLAYMPKNTNAIEDSIFPEGMELVHPRYAIDRRNKWMISHSDYVIAYITHNFGGAAEFVKKSKKKRTWN